MSGRTLPLWGLLLSAAACWWAMGSEGVAQTTNLGMPPIQPAAPRGSRYPRHVGTYEPLRLTWKSEAAVPDAVAVFPDRHRPAHVLAATADGLCETLDNARSWKKVPAAAKDNIGPITTISYHSRVLDTWYVGTKGHGIFITSDGGKTLKPLASKETGLASNAVASIYQYAGDKMQRTLLVAHGEDAPGLSRSFDGGHTWQTLFPDVRIYQVAAKGGSSEMILVGATTKQPDVRNVYYLPSLTEPWQALITDTLSAYTAVPLLPRDAVYVATGDKGFFRLSRSGGVTRKIGPQLDSEWASFGCTYSETADAELFYAYDPRKLGFVLMTREQLEPDGKGEDAAAPEDGQDAPLVRPKSPYSTQSQGLYTGAIVMDGAHVRANANGGQFYGVVNKTLYVGRNSVSRIMVSDVTLFPPLLELRPNDVRDSLRDLDDSLTTFNSQRNVLRAARQLEPELKKSLAVLGNQRFTITARIDRDAARSVKSVTVDLSRLRLSERSPLYDDGSHNDGAANDGVYGNTFGFDSIMLHNFQQDWRPTFPGPLGLTVSAVADDNSLAGSVGLLTLVEPPVTSVPFWISGGALAAERVTGDVKVSAVRSRKTYATAMHRATVSKPGKWSVYLVGRWGPEAVRDVTGYYAISFLIRADHDCPDGLFIQFRDHPTYALPTSTPPVPLLAEGHLPSKKVTPTWQRVTVPIARILQDSGEFQAGVTRGMILSGDSSAPTEYAIRDIRFFSTKDDIPQNDTGEE